MKYLAFPFAAALAAFSIASPDISSEASTTMTGIKDNSNTWYNTAETGYGFSCTTSASDPAYYINSIQLVGGAGWDSNLTFDISNHLRNGFASNDYTLGTAMTQGTTYYWSNVLDHIGIFNSSIANGIYSFDALFKGGTDASASDTLFDAQLQVEIVDKLDVTVTPSYDTDTIAQGQTSTVSNTLTNNMSDRSFVSTTWFISSVNNGADELGGNFVGDWFDKTIASGESRTDLQSTWTASPTQPAGLYTGSTGIVGGLYNGDQFYFGDPGNTRITVVTATPEPLSLLSLGAGVLALARRRRKG